MDEKQKRVLILFFAVIVLLLTVLNPTTKAEPILIDSTGASVGTTGYRFTDMVAVDLDGDGDDDLVTSNVLGQLTAWENQGVPFDVGWPSVLIGRRYRTSTIAAGDLDNDGDMDIATGYRWYTDLVVWENDGTPFSGTWSYWVVGHNLSNIGALAIADINLDGQMEIVSGGGPSADVDAPSTNNRVTIWLNAPLETTWTSVDVGETYYSVRDIVVGDLDGDIDLDIVIGTNHAPSAGSSEEPVPQEEWADVYQVRAFRQDSVVDWVPFNVGRDPEFETLSVLYHGYWGAHISSVALADVDGDFDLDVVASEHMEGDFQALAYENDGTPFSGELWRGAAISYPQSRFHNWLAANIMDIAVGDFDQDGDVDLASVSNQTETHQLIVWENLNAVVWEDWTSMTFDPERVGDYSTGWLRHDIATLGGNMMRIGASDLERDGDLDLISTAYLDTEPNALVVWQNHLLAPEATPTPENTPTPTLTPTPDGNSAPVPVSFDADHGTGVVGEAQTFTTTYFDANSWTDLRIGYLLVNIGLQGNGLSSAYYRDSNRLYLANDAANGWVGWCTPGTPQYLSNSYVSLDCAATAISGLENTMTINWRIIPTAPFSDTYGTYTAFLRVTDMSGIRSAWENVGEWVLEEGSVTPTATMTPTPSPTATQTPTPGGNSPPTVGLFVPDGGSGSIGTAQVFSTTYMDLDGLTDLRRVSILMNVGLQGQGLMAMYYLPQNRFFLSNDEANGWVGYCTPGESQVLSNNFVSLDCSGSGVSGAAETLVVDWLVTPLAPFSGSYGEYQVYLRAMDLAGDQSGWVATGTWTLTE